MMFDTNAISAELDRLHEQARHNGLDAATARTFAGGQIHEQLAVIVRGWKDRKADEPQRPDDLNETEWAVLQELFTSSDGNGHDFGFTDDISCVTAAQKGGYVSQLSQKGYIIVDEPYRVNDADVVVQFNFTMKGFKVFGVGMTREEFMNRFGLGETDMATDGYGDRSSIQ
jgi:hypothetical protein